MPIIPPDGNDVLVWMFGESGSTHFNNGTSGSSGNLTTINSVIKNATGIFDDCAYFPGLGNYPTGASATRNTIYGANTVNPPLPITISGWINLRYYNTSVNNIIVAKAFRDPTINDDWATPFVSLSIATTFSDDGRDWVVQVYNGTSLSTLQINGNPIPLGVWSHIGMTYDGSQLKAYLNGMQAVFYSSGQQNFLSVSGDISYTNGVDGYGPWFFGAIQADSIAKEEPNYSIQDFRVANVARPASYFKNIYKAGVLNLEQASVPILYYKLRAYDSGCVTPTPVTWIDTEISLTNAPAPACGGPYINLEVIDKWLV